MGKYLFFVFLSLPMYFTADNGDKDYQLEYIQDYSDLAVREMERTGIPASIKLAQAILESNAGRSELAIKARNHFGIKCGSGWDGPTYSLQDDERDASGQHIASCFRVYKEVRGSYKAHSDFLSGQDKSGRYGFLFRLPPTDYAAWARGLQRAGYATNPNYAKLLIELIQRHNLDKYDQLSPEAQDHLAGLGSINDVRLAFARKDETLEQIALRTEVPVSKLVRYNEDYYNPEQVLAENSIVYLQPKRSFFRGKIRWHKVQEGETFADIAQLYGVKTDKLRKKNRTRERYEPLPGEKIKLRGRVKQNQTPKTRLPLPAREIVSPLTESDEALKPVSNEAPGDILQQKSDSVLDTTRIPSNNTQTVVAPVSKPIWYTVTAGDTLWRIAYKYGVTIEQIKKLNKLEKDQVNTGQKLLIKE